MANIMIMIGDEYQYIYQSIIFKFFIFIILQLSIF
jgi:hypothetical protein